MQTHILIVHSVVVGQLITSDNWGYMQAIFVYGVVMHVVKELQYVNDIN